MSPAGPVTAAGTGTAVVTGAASGIGAATVAALLANDTAVVALDLAEPATGTRRYAVDVADPDEVVDAVEDAAAALGPVGMLATCAGISGPGTVTDDLGSWHRMMQVNLFGTLHCLRAVLPGMRARGGGSVVTVGSVAAHRGGGLLGGAPYATSKAGVLGLTRAAARELAPDGIRVNAVAPGPVDSPMLRADGDPHRFAHATLLERIADPDEIATAIRYLLSPAAASVTGETLNVNGGAHFSA